MNEYPPLAAGEKIYTTEYRDVFEYLFDPEWMIKTFKPEYALLVEKISTGTGARIDLNALELETYQRFQTYGLSSWLAPCKFENGLFLMKRPQALAAGSYQVPTFLNKDPKYWGSLNGQLVVTEYSYDFVTQNGNTYLILKLAHEELGLPEVAGQTINLGIKGALKNKIKVDSTLINFMSSRRQTIVVA